MIYLRIFILVLISINVYAKDTSIKALYSENAIKGSILIESADGKTKYQYNVDDNRRYIPASTFKIPNTLIILEEGLLSNQDQVIKWDGKQRTYASWNQDQTLASAFKYSCVWCYQVFSEKVGNDKYLSYLAKFHYGNRLTGDDITRFWLDGDIKISVKEQINFLRKVYEEDLPVNNAHIKTLKNIMLSDEKQHYKIWSKTGWSGKDGWYVGYITTETNTWFFANHIEIDNNASLSLRKSLVIDVFKMLNIIK
ncbi:penicillin-binding transpeptidase domain-containing protein [Thalassotalea piscium]